MPTPTEPREKPEHSPLPWFASEIAPTHIFDAGNHGVCKFESIHGLYQNYSANAALIVHSVNTLPTVERQRDALLEAAKLVLPLHIQAALVLDGEHGEPHRNAVVLISSAIAAVEKGEGS